MSRLGLIPELAFAEGFKQLRRDVSEIKRAQLVGRDILKPKIIECLDVYGVPTVYDLVATAVPDGYGGYTVRKDFAARFQADHQDEPFGSPLFKLSFGSPTTPATPGQTYGSAYPFISDFQTTPGKVTYHGWFGNNIYGDATSVYLKVYFYATDTGVLTVTAEPYV